MTSDSKDNGSVESRVIQVLDTIRPMLQADGGDIEFIEVDNDGVVKVSLHGACVGCPCASITLSQGVESRLKEMIPEVTKVVNVQ